MIIDLTTKIEKYLMEQWLETQNNTHIAMGHIGTHLDVYNKSEVPLDYVKTTGVLIDVSGISEVREIQIEDISGIALPEKSFVCFRTGRSENAVYGTPEYFASHPQLSDTLIDYLLNQKISFIGIDCCGIRRGEEHEQADRLCEKKGVYVIENLSNLDKLSDMGEFQIFTLWFDDDVATGLPCRVLAEVTGAALRK